MTIAPAQSLAFRCSKCFQTRCSSADCVGQSMTCEFCGQENIVPEATEDRLAQGLAFLQTAASELGELDTFSKPDGNLTDQQIMKQAREEVYGKAGPQALVCSKTRRFFGLIIDAFASVLAFGIGFALAAVVAPINAASTEPNLFAMSLMFGIPIMLQLIQWGLTATEGRTIGKYCVNTKVVNLQGNPPGFLQGVFLRYWVNALLGLIPLYGLIDALAIFMNDSHRCVHDLIAGTYVIDAS